MRTGVVMMVKEILQQPCALQDVRLWGRMQQVYSYQGFGSGSGLDPYSIGPLDPDPDP